MSIGSTLVTVSCLHIYLALAHRFLSTINLFKEYEDCFKIVSPVVVAKCEIGFMCVFWIRVIVFFNEFDIGFGLCVCLGKGYWVLLRGWCNY